MDLSLYFLTILPTINIVSGVVMGVSGLCSIITCMIYSACAQNYTFQEEKPTFVLFLVRALFVFVISMLIFILTPDQDVVNLIIQKGVLNNA